MEAMASGRPVVCSRVGGLPGLVSHEESGLLVPPADPTALVKSILRLLEDRELGERLASGARMKISRYDNRILCEQLFDIYEKDSAGADDS
jgi:glycosyltransferase involved in cell wall biosynthesis